MRTVNDSRKHRAAVLRGALAAAGALLAACAGPVGAPEAPSTAVYFVRHAETNLKHPERPLYPEGHARAERWVKYFASVPVTYVYATHTDRTRDTVAPLAKARGMAVKLFPPIGSELDGKIVVNRTPEPAAIKPMVAALRALPPGSTAVVAGNSINVFPIIAGIGVKADPSCTAERNDCLPCVTRECFDTNRFDEVWKVVIGRDGKTTLSRASSGN
jgi:hypothetical protein